MPPDADEGLGLPGAPPEPTAVHFMERPPEDHDAGTVQLLQSGGHDVEFLHPAVVCLVTGREDLLQVHALVAQAAALGIGRVVKVGRDGDQAALPGVLDRPRG